MTSSVCWCPRCDQVSGYRYYDVAELEAARLVAMLRQLELPLAAIKELLACDPPDAAERIAEHWRKIETAHDVWRELADYLVNRLSGKRSVTYEVATREIQERTLLCLKRHVDEPGAWALGKEFIAYRREGPLPKMEGREGAMFSIYWSEVSADSDGPVEWCKPIPASEAKALASHYPELSLRIEPAHREAYVAPPNDAIQAGRGANPGVQWQLAGQALGGLGGGRRHQRSQSSSSSPKTSESASRTSRASFRSRKRAPPYCDFAVPFTSHSGG